MSEATEAPKTKTRYVICARVDATFADGVRSVLCELEVREANGAHQAIRQHVEHTQAAKETVASRYVAIPLTNWTEIQPSATQPPPVWELQETEPLFGKALAPDMELAEDPAEDPAAEEGVS